MHIVYNKTANGVAGWTIKFKEIQRGGMVWDEAGEISKDLVMNGLSKPSKELSFILKL